MLDNKLNINNIVELSKEVERITKINAIKLYDTNKINEIEERFIRYTFLFI